MRYVILVEYRCARYREELARAGVLLAAGDRIEVWLADFDEAVPPELREQEEYLRAAMSFPAPTCLPVHEKTDVRDGRLA